MWNRLEGFFGLSKRQARRALGSGSTTHSLVHNLGAEVLLGLPDNLDPSATRSRWSRMIHRGTPTATPAGSTPGATGGTPTGRPPVPPSTPAPPQPPKSTPRRRTTAKPATKPATRPARKKSASMPKTTPLGKRIK